MVYKTYMEITTTTIEQNPNRRAAINALAAVGFIVLIAIGVALAIWSARYVPKAVSRIGSAAVSLSSVFRGHDEGPAQLGVVSTSTLPIDGPVAITAPVATTTNPAATSNHTGTTGSGSGSVSTQTVTTVVNKPAPLYGNPDLTVTITNVGYLRSGDDTDTFVASNSVPDNKEGAVQFTVANNGTNTTGTWKFKADIPTSPSLNYTSPTQPSMKPGDRIEYTLGFDRTKSGNNREITITVDSGHDVNESNENNNEDSENVDIRN